MQTAFLVVLVGLSVAFWRLMSPFWNVFVLAFVLAHLFQRPYGYLSRRTGKPPIAAGLTMLLIVVVVAVPLAIVGALVSSEGAAGVVALQNALPRVRTFTADFELRERLLGLPFIGEYLEGVPELDVAGMIRSALSTIADFLLRFSQQSFINIGTGLLGLSIMLFLLYYILVDGKRVAERLRDNIPLPNAEIDQFAQDALTTISATLMSTVVIGLMEGALTVVLFLIVGISSPFLWGVIVIVVSLIPMVGTSLVVVPAAIILFMRARLWAGLLITVVGLGGIFLTQNVIKPKLLGDRAAMHPAVALLATLGGVSWVGLVGFIVGPVIASLFVVVWRQFAQRYATLLQGKNG